MPRIDSMVDSHGVSFQERGSAFQKIIDEFAAKMKSAALGISEESHSRHKSHGKLLPRDQVGQLLDPGSPLLELSPLLCGHKYRGAKYFSVTLKSELWG